MILSISNELDKVCKLGKAALYETDFKEGGMEVFFLLLYL